MKGTARLLGLIVLLWSFLFLVPSPAPAADPIVIGVPTSLGFLEGAEGLNAVNLAVEEINAKGGVTIKGEKHPLKVEALDIRDAAPGVPVPEALLGIEKLILEKKIKAIVLAPFRSEALLASMDLISKHKVPMLATTAMSPDYGKKVLENYDKYKYCFRVCLDAGYLVGYLKGSMEYVQKEYGFKKVFLMHQDVAWARATANGLAGILKGAGWEVLGVESYPTGAGDFSAGLMKARQGGAQVILPIFDMPQSGILVKQWNSMKVPALLLGFISPLAGPGAWKSFEGKIDGAMNLIFEIGNVPVKKVPKSVAFYEAYKKKYKKDIEAGHSPAPTYESVYILAEAMEKAGTTDPDAVVAAMEKTDRQGAIGRIRFGKNHQVVFGNDPKETAMAAMIQWSKAGTREIVFPDTIADVKIHLPEGLKSAK
ncbi:MAG: ABC transporter substrate-binding protein [Deltaproteobacteria bacterium]|nr:ABC transporter substrate-binding protein [Deltaproteobacteria bacterium]